MSSLQVDNIVEQRRWKLPKSSAHAIELISEYGVTFATEFAVLGCQLLTYKLAAHKLGQQGFSEYAVARRVISLLYPIPLLGLGVGLPRYIAHATGAGNPRAMRYFGTAFWCVIVALLLCTLLMNGFRGGFAYLFFASQDYVSLVFPLNLLLIGLTLHALVYGYFRGRLAMKSANILQLINLGLVPLISFFVFSSSVRAVLISLGTMTMLSACLALATTPLLRVGVGMSETKELLGYGLQRVSGDFIHMALFTLPVTFVTHWHGVKEAGFMAFSISFLSMVGSVFTPIGLVLLPKASKMLAEQNHHELNLHIFRIGAITIAAATAFTLFFEFFAAVVIRVYLGQGFEAVVAMVRVVGFAILPFCLYCVLRSLIDAFYTKGVNMINNGIAFIVFLICFRPFLLFNNPSLLPLAFVVGIFVLGFLTVGEAWKILRRREIVPLMSQC